MRKNDSRADECCLGIAPRHSSSRALSFWAAALTFIALDGTSNAWAQTCPVGSGSPAGCTANCINGNLDTVTTTARHGDKVCFTVDIFNGGSPCCDVSGVDATLNIGDPDGSGIAPPSISYPIITNAYVARSDFFTCPGVDSRCVTPGNCTIPGGFGYEYTVAHDDEHGVTGDSCPPTPVVLFGGGEISAFVQGAGTLCRQIQTGVNLCKSLAIDIPHGACCEPCSGTCTPAVTCNDCPGNSIFTPDGDCSVSCLLTCGDNDACTTDGVCLPGGGRNNCAVSPGGTPATCGPDVHVCVDPPPGFTCEDGLACTVDECADDLDPATACCSRSDLCPPDVRCCADGASCNDNNVCTHNVCVDGECCANPPITCPPVPCMRNTGCDPIAGCQYEFDCREPGKNCCPEPGNCATSTCHPKTGQCGLTADCRFDQECNDNDACTADDCTADGCCEHSPVTCNDQNDCTADSCNPATGCVYAPACTSNHDCKDDSACTEDICTLAGCCEHPPVTCNDQNDCTADSCNPATGCVYAPACTSNHDCKDDNACTQDICTPAGCCEHPPVNCDDNNSCTTDSCDPVSGCVHDPECSTGQACKDDNACTDDICNANGCCEHRTRDCNDHDACTTEKCNPTSGCVYTVITCNDNNDCTTDSCNPANGCVFSPQCLAAADCANDSDPCTLTVCVGGCCRQQPQSCCGNGTLETGETCDPPGPIPDGRVCRNDCTFCGDGITNGPEQCDDGNIVNDDLCTNACIRKGTPCDDGDPCTEDLCVCVHGNHNDNDNGGNNNDNGNDNGDNDNGDDDDGDDHNRAKVGHSGKVKQYARSAGVSARSGGGHGEDDDDDDNGNDNGDGNDNDDHDGDDDHDGGGQPCECPPSACDDDHNVATGDYGDNGNHNDNDNDNDNGDDDDGDDAPSCVCVHRRICTSECCGNCDDGNPCTEDFCTSSSDDHDGDDDGYHVASGNNGDCVCQHRSICDDKNACTEDICTLSGCEHPALTCKDHSDCTTDSCNPSTGCVFTPECNSDSDCGAVSKPCVQARCYEGCCVEHTGGCCGNGTVDDGETCDPPGSSQDNGKICRDDCTFCGDGIKNGNEQCDDGNSNNGDSCNAKCVPVQHATEGCTPGFWKQTQHFEYWVVYHPSDLYDTVFGVTSTFAANTLLEAVEQGGGGEIALGRHAVAALLNAANNRVDYAFETGTVIHMVKQAYATGDFETIKNLLASENERGCPW